MKRRVGSLALGLTLALIYVCAGKVSLTLASVNRSATPVWLPTGISLALLVLGGYRLWPAVLVGSFVVNATVPNTQLTSALLVVCGNTLEAVCGALLTRRLAGGENAFESA